MQDYVEEVANRRALSVSRDAARNLVVRRPGSGGGASAPPIIVQTHLDMVCEKNIDTVHDWARDPITAVVRDGWLIADNTTLGADNGIGVALSLALMEQPSSWKAPPLEVVFTVEEETGMDGAHGLDVTALSGRRLLNFDTEEWGIIYIGCAGGGDAIIELPIETDPKRSASAATFSVTLEGLRGGHSGVNIDEGRGNAVLLLARALSRLQKTSLMSGLWDFQGGNLDNAIPRQASAIISVELAQASQLQAEIANLEEELRLEFGRVDPDLSLIVSKVDLGSDTQTLLSEDSADRLLDLLLALPAGIVKMSHEVPGLVETSNNVARIRRLRPGVFEVLCLARSSVTPALTHTLDVLARVARRCGGTTSRNKFFPGWAPKQDQELLARAERVFADSEGLPPNVTAIHAGLECGVIGGKIPGIEMISFGPTIKGAHAPGERVHVDSVARMTKFTDWLMADLAARGHATEL